MTAENFSNPALERQVVGAVIASFDNAAKLHDYPPRAFWTPAHKRLFLVAYDLPRIPPTRAEFLANPFLPTLAEQRAIAAAEAADVRLEDVQEMVAERPADERLHSLAHQLLDYADRRDLGAALLDAYRAAESGAPLEEIRAIVRTPGGIGL